jgi:hypothetical protein
VGGNPLGQLRHHPVHEVQVLAHHLSLGRRT